MSDRRHMHNHQASDGPDYEGCPACVFQQRQQQEMDEALRAAIVRVLTTKPIMEREQGRSFPMTTSEANYAARCLLLDAEIQALWAE